MDEEVNRDDNGEADGMNLEVTRHIGNMTNKYVGPRARST